MKRYEVRGIYYNPKGCVHQIEVIKASSDRSAKNQATRRHPDIAGNWQQQRSHYTGETIPVWEKESPKESQNMLIVTRERDI